MQTSELIDYLAYHEPMVFERHHGKTGREKDAGPRVDRTVRIDLKRGKPMRIQRVFSGMAALLLLLATWQSTPGQVIGYAPGYDPTANAYDVMMGVEGIQSPAGNWGAPCCGPHWYDFSVEAAFLKRDDAGRNVDLGSDGIAGALPPNVVLSTSDLDFDFEPGVRASARYQVGAVHNIEANFLGAIDWSTHAVVRGNDPQTPDTLYSVFSEFGNNPLGGYVAFGTGQSFVQSLRYSSEFDSVELNMRRTWQTRSCRVYGSCLAGIRYVRLAEEFDYASEVQDHADPINGGNTGDSSMLYSTDTDNDLIGFQIGGELTGCILPGLLIGTDIKAGIYGNSAKQGTVVRSTGLNNDVIEFADSDEAAFVGEFGIFLMHQIHPLVKIRGGYSLLVVDGVALATENFNPESPFTGADRTVSINDNGNAFYHGGLLGLELGW